MIEIVPPVAIETPCVGICQIDDDGRCAGCARTLDEIARWTRESPAWRAAVMAALPGRRQAG